MQDTLIDSRVSRAESVARRLEAEIMDEVVAPGALLGTKDELRRRFGVAVATVNEAVRLLEMRGLIDARPGRGGGIFVASDSQGMALSHSTLRFKGGSSGFPDYLAVRDALEPLICREAARNHDAEDIAALERVLGQMQRHIDDPHAYMRLNYKLHRRIARLSSNAPLHRIYIMLLDSMEEALERAELDDFDGAAHLAEHRDLIAAIDLGESDELEVAIARQSPSYMVSRPQATRRR
jgi:GntR family transcriptional regulator, transcriptional repressor for pyruvate dehydrogenase complex